MKTLLFDLDGTLTDPRLGIINSFQYALDKLGCPQASEQQLLSYIGPPLQNSFSDLLNSDEQALIQTAVSYYREWYSTNGLFENELYDGIRPLLHYLFQQGHTMFVATSKASVFAEQIIDHFELSSFFKRVYGSNLDGSLSDKADLLRHILENEQLNSENVLMIGDRLYDISGALKNHITPIGVLWGYGDHDELAEAGASHICSRPEELRDIAALE